MKTSANNSFAREVKAHDYDRYLAISWTPPQKREALYTITAFNSELARISEQVSEPMLGHIRLAWWREALEEIVAGKPTRSHPLVATMAQLHAQSPHIFDHAFRMIEARAVDLDPSVLVTTQDWIQYLDNTAGALHHAWAEILDKNAATAEQENIYAQARRYATLGLIRTIPYQQQGKWRFSQEQLNAHNLSTEKSNERLVEMVQVLVESSVCASAIKLTHASLRSLQATEALSKRYKMHITRAGYDPSQVRISRLTKILSVFNI